MKLPRSLVGKPVYVEWLDAMQNPGDGLSTKDVGISVICRTVGWCIEVSKDGLKVALDEADGSYRMALGIPVTYIKRLWTLSPSP